MKKRFKWICGGAAAAAFVLLQLTNPPRTNPPVVPGHDLLASNAPPEHIAGILRAACYDCHSSETRWPWYSHVAPVSWWLVDHINDARKQLNFSDWPHNDARRAARKWRRVSDEVSSGDMPLRSYTWIHAAARLSPAQRDELAKWAGQQAARLQPEAGEAEAAH